MKEVYLYKWFWGAIIIISVSWIGNNIYFQTKQLREPIIFNIFSDRPAYERISFPLPYPYLTKKCFANFSYKR